MIQLDEMNQVKETNQKMIPDEIMFSRKSASGNNNISFYYEYPYFKLIFETKSDSYELDNQAKKGPMKSLGNKNKKNTKIFSIRRPKMSKR